MKIPQTDAEAYAALRALALAAPPGCGGIAADGTVWLHFSLESRGFVPGALSQEFPFLRNLGRDRLPPESEEETR